MKRYDTWGPDSLHAWSPGALHEAPAGEYVTYADYKSTRDTLLASLAEARTEAEEFRDAYCGIAGSTLALPWEAK